MKGRGLVVFLALILATLATVGVFMYTRGVKEEPAGTMVQVVVSDVDIPARTDLDQLIKDDEFKVIQVPENVVVDGAVTSVDQLAGKNNSVAILAGEQIPSARISGNVPGGALAIPDGMEAITVSLDAPRGVAGAINAGDHVTIYSTFNGIPGKGTAKETATVVLVPTAELLAVFRPLSSSTFGGGEEPTSGEQVPGTLTVTLALTPEDAQHFVFSMETGSTWFGLLPPDTSGQPMEPISYAQVVK